MILSFENDAENRDYLLQFKDVLEEDFNANIVRKNKLKSLLCIVVTRNSEEGFKNTVYEYAKGMNVECSISDNCEAKVLNKLNADNNLKQIIFVKSRLIKALICVCDFTELAWLTILHEFGHVIDNEIRYNWGSYINHPTKFNLKTEEQEYLVYLNLSLWSEYFAEKFAFESTRYKADIKKREEELICYINKCNDDTVKLGTIYETLYKFVMYFVAFKELENNISIYEKFKDDANINQYVTLLDKYAFELLKLNEKYPKFNINLESEHRDTKEIEIIYFDVLKLALNNKNKQRR